MKFLNEQADSLESLNHWIDANGHDAPGWPVLYQLIRNLFVSPATGKDGQPICDSRPYFYGWLQQSFIALREGVDSTAGPPRAQALFIAGEPNCGKTLLTEILRVILGGRRGFPYAWLVGETNFNSDLFEACLLLVDDEADKTDIRSRHNLAQKLKQIVVGSAGRMEGKGKDALELDPLWRLVMVCNVDPDSLRVLPPLDMVGDKVLLLKGERRAMPMPTNTPRQQKLFWMTLMHELPYFLHWLINDFVLPEEFGPTARFPVNSWHHPEVVELMDELTPWREFWELLARTVLQDQHTHNDVDLPDGCWAGTCQELVEIFRSRGESYNMTRTEIGKLTSRGIGRHLTVAAERWPNRAIPRKSGSVKTWWISAEGWPDPVEVGR